MAPRRARIGVHTAAMVCVVLLAGCSSSTHRTSPHTVTTAHVTTTTAPKPTPKTTTTTPSVVYRVKSGDRLTTIARRFRTSIAAIIYVNHVANPDRLTEGQVLRIPTHAPLVLLITPPKGPAGQRFEFALIGAKKAEVIKFGITSPAGKHVGPPHIATADGTVTTRYATSTASPSGTYRVTATGNKGTKTQASFVVVKRP